MADTYAEAMARFYDGAYTSSDKFERDIPFYVDLAKAADGPVLEVGCGTGRVLLACARAGVEMTGLDASPEMLAVLTEKLRDESEAVRGHVHGTHLGDMRTFELGRQFALITVPFRPLQHMITLDDQIAALSRMRSHLAPNGRLAFDVFYPKWEMLQGPTDEALDLEWPDASAPGVTVKRFFRRLAVHRNAQYFDGEFIFRRYRGEELLDEVRAPLEMSYFTYPHLQLLFRLAGLRVVEEYGDFQRGPIDDANEMIFVLGRDE